MAGTLDRILDLRILDYVENVCWVEHALHVNTGEVSFTLQQIYRGDESLLFLQHDGEVSVQVIKNDTEPPCLVFYECLRMLEHNRRRYYDSMAGYSYGDYN